MNFRYGEIFCGPGGLAKAAELSKILVNDEEYYITHEWATDYDKDSCNTYRHNICPNNPESVICEDIRKLDFNRLSHIDALAFGFPCNDYSVVGERKGINGEFGPLYTYGVKALNKFKPMWFLAENVSGLKSSNQGQIFQKILTAFANAGYTLTTHLYKFENYNVPQRRHRIIIIGIRSDLNLIFKVPRPFNNIISAREAIEIPPISSNINNHELTKQSDTVIERLKYIKPGQNAWNSDLPDHLKLNVKSARLSHIYKRLDPDKPAYTITGSGGGGTHTYHWRENRALTNRERARLQTFPDDYFFAGSKESVRKQIGMAVPVKGAMIIFESILKTLAGVKYEHIEPSIGYKYYAESEKMFSEQGSLIFE